MKKITKAQIRILDMFRGGKTVQVFKDAGYNQHPAINALIRNGLIEDVTGGGYYAYYKLTDQGKNILDAQNEED